MMNSIQQEDEFNDWDIISLEDYSPGQTVIELQPLLSLTQLSPNDNVNDSDNDSDNENDNDSEDDSTIESLSPSSINSIESMNTLTPDEISITIECPELQELCELFPYENEQFLYLVLLETDYEIKSALNQICENRPLIRQLRKSVQKNRVLSNCWKWWLRVFCCPKHFKTF